MPVAPDAVLTIRVFVPDDPSGQLEWAIWISAGGNAQPDTTLATSAIGASTLEIARRWFRRTQRWSGSASAAITEVKRLGVALANAAPPELHQAYAAAAAEHTSLRIQFLTNEPYLPWELLLPNADPTGFPLLLRHPCARAFSRSADRNKDPDLHESLGPGEVVSMIPQGDDGATPLPAHAKELCWRLRQNVGAELRSANGDELTQWIERAKRSGAAALLLTAHLVRGEIRLSDDALTPTSIRHRPVQTGASRPLMVFFGGMADFDGDPADTPMPVVSAFLDSGFGGVLAPLFGFPTAAAAEIVERALGHALGSEHDSPPSVAEALHWARNKLLSEIPELRDTDAASEAAAPRWSRDEALWAALSITYYGAVKGRVLREPESPQEVGFVVGERYRLWEQMAHGRFGEVWRALDQRLGIPVAVKMIRIHPEFSLERFAHEAATLRLLGIPSVVKLLDDGEYEGNAFLVMPILEGSRFPGADLASPPGMEVPIPWSKLQGPTLHLLEALARVHLEGIVHRDLKEDNLLVDRHGRVTIIDFGLACDWTADHFTTFGSGGTRELLAPEQAVGGEISTATDVFTVGVILYRALTAKLPFASYQRQPHTPIRHHVPDLPREVADVIDAMLDLIPAQRPQSAGEVLHALFPDRVRQVADLAWIGGVARIQPILDAIEKGTPIAVVGPRGSGKSRLLAEIARALSARGRKVHLFDPSSRSIWLREEVVGSLVLEPTARAEVALDAIVEWLSDCLDRGDVVLFDALESLDAPTAKLALRLRSRGAVVVACRTAPPGYAVWEIPPLSEADLLGLFAPGDTFAHTAEDAAQVLWEHTGGWPLAVSLQLGAWKRAGCMEQIDHLFSVDRRYLDRLRSGTMRLDPLDIGDASEAQRLPEAANDLLGWIWLLHPEATLEALSNVTGEPFWRVEMNVEVVLAHKAAYWTADRSRLLPRRPPEQLASWTAEERRARHARAAECLAAGAPGRFIHRLRGGDPQDPAYVAKVLEEACSSSDALFASQPAGVALSLLREAVSVGRLSSGVPDALADIFARWAEVAIAERQSEALDTLLYELDRTGDFQDKRKLQRMAKLARNLGHVGAAALPELEAIGPLRSARLERCRQSMRVLAARWRGVSEEERVLEELGPWAREAGDSETACAYEGWLGRLRYRQERYESAAEHYTRAAQTTNLSERLRVFANRLAALLEAGSSEATLAAAREAISLAANYRRPVFEAHATWVYRCVQYRMGLATSPEPHLLRAAAALGTPDVAAQIALNEAAIAYRYTGPESALELARLAHRLFVESGRVPGQSLARALMAACGDKASLDAARTVSTEPPLPPLVELQVVALLARAGIRPEPWINRDACLSVARRVPAEMRSRPLEVLSVDECLAEVSA